MKQCVKLINGNLKRIVLSKTFFVCCLCVGALAILDVMPCFFSSVRFDESGRLIGGTTVMTLFELGGYTLFYLVLLSPCVIAGATIYCVDMEHNIFRQIIIRSSHCKYVVATFITCGILGFLCMAAGYLIMTGFYSLFVPLCRGAEAYTDSPFPLLQKGKYSAYIMVGIIQRGLKGTFFAMLSLLVSAFVRNKFVITTVPVLLYYFLANFGFSVLGESFDAVNVQIVYDIFAHGTEISSTLFALGYTLIAGIIFGVVFYRVVRRKCE